jgi:membrane-bound metal-dependent hydrolase YbcI (DUF457 family)
MFIGHPAVGLASKGTAPRVSLGLLVLAPMLLDFLWPVFLLTGVEHFRIDPGNTAFTPLDFYDYPWSHSLLMSCVWGALMAVIYFAFRRDGRGALLLGFGVVSHWILDYVTHRPDLPLYPGGPKVGLGLWNSVAGTVALEVSIFAIAVYLYVRDTRAVDRVGSIGFWSLIAVLLLIYAGNLAGGPPPATNVVALASLSLLVVPLWAAWADRHRETTLHP